MPVLELAKTIDAADMHAIASAIASDAQAIAQTLPLDTGDAVIRGVKGAIAGAASGAAVGAAIGAVAAGAAVAIGAGDIALGVGVAASAAAGVGAGAAMGAAVGGVGAIVGAVIGFLVAVGGAQGSDAGFSDPNINNQVRDTVGQFLDTNPISPLLVLAIQHDKQFRDGLTRAIGARFDWSVFEKWLRAFLQGKATANKLFQAWFRKNRHTYSQPVIDASVDLFAEFCARVREAEVAFVASFGAFGNAIDPSDREAAGRWQSAAELAASAFLHLPHGTRYSADVKARVLEDEKEGVTVSVGKPFIRAAGSKIVVELTNEQMAAAIAGAHAAQVKRGKVPLTGEPVGGYLGNHGGIIQQLGRTDYNAAMDAIVRYNKSKHPLAAPLRKPQLGRVTLVHEGATAAPSFWDSIVAFFKRIWHAIAGEPAVQGFVGLAFDNPMMTSMRSTVLLHGQRYELSDSTWRAALGSSSSSSPNVLAAVAVLRAFDNPETSAVIVERARAGDATASALVTARTHAEIVRMKISAEQLAGAAVAGDESARARCERILVIALRDPSGLAGAHGRLIGDAYKQRLASTESAAMFARG